MRVLHVIDKSFLGGGQTAVRHLLAGAAGCGVQARLACRDGGPLVGAARDLGVPVDPIPFDKTFRPGRLRSLAAVVEGWDAEVVHAHGLVAATHCVLARSFQSSRPPLIYHQHGFHDHNYGAFSRPFRKAAERAVCRRAERVVAVSRADASRLAAGGYARPGRIVRIPYGIPEPAARPAESEAARRETGLATGLPVVGLIGRLHPQKGIDVFLRAAAQVAREAPEARFLVVGGGELEAPLRELAAGLGLDGSLVWAGSRPAPPFLPLLSVAVLSSHWEGLPLVLLEYMAAGLAVVTTDVDGCRDAVGPDEAEIVPRGDSAALAAAVLRLLRSQDLARRRGEAARRRFEDEFALDIMAARFAALYRSLLP